MRIGFNLPNKRADGSAPTVRDLMERAKVMEDIGVDGIWLGDTVGRMRNITHDVFAWNLAAAASTERIELGTSIFQMPLRHPVELAQRIMSLFVLSGGRFTIGLGAGSLPMDFEAVGVDHAQRFRLYNEGVPLIRKLLNGDTDGAPNLNFWPDAIGWPKMIIGSWRDEGWIERAAKDYDGWMASAHNTSVGLLLENSKRYRELGGRRAMIAVVTVNFDAEAGPMTDNDDFSLRCGVDEALVRLNTLADAGVEDIISGRLNFAAEDFPAEQMKRIVDVLHQVPVRSQTAPSANLDRSHFHEAHLVRDPVCARLIPEDTTTPVVFEGETYHLCNLCKPSFEADPARYVAVIRR